jgi:hypothetical protein
MKKLLVPPTEGPAVKNQPNVPLFVEFVPAYHVDVVAYALIPRIDR